jgi:hypothetical protein
VKPPWMGRHKILVILLFFIIIFQVEKIKTPSIFTNSTRGKENEERFFKMFFFSALDSLVKWALIT